jgi:hypothetical protein
VKAVVALALHQRGIGSGREAWIVELDREINPTPPAGQQKGTKVLEVAFPTDYLSTAVEPPKKKTKWIVPAPAGMSIILECFFTNDAEEVVRSFAAPGRSLQMYVRLPKGDAFCATTFQSDFAGQDFSIPKSHGHEEDFVILRNDPDAQGRPVRVSMFDNPKDGDPMVMWEYGAVRRRQAPQHGATLTRNTILDGTDWGRSSKPTGEPWG